MCPLKPYPPRPTRLTHETPTPRNNRPVRTVLNTSLDNTHRNLLPETRRTAASIGAVYRKGAREPKAYPEGSPRILHPNDKTEPKITSAPIGDSKQREPENNRHHRVVKLADVARI